MSTILETRGLTHVYGAGTPFERVALDHVNLKIEKSEILGVIGHTGSGKSTLIQHLNGLLKPSAGEVLLDGQSIWNEKGKCARETRFRVGLVFQYPEYQLFEETIAKDIAYGPSNMGLSQGEIDERVRESMRAVGLADEMAEQSPFALSGGQKRRVAIAGVIAMRPDVLVLDEPTAGLDPAGRDEILGLVRRYHEQSGATVLIVSHSMEDIARLADRLLVMDHAKVLFCDTPREVFSHADEIIAAGLDIPMITKVMLELKQRGYEVDTSVFTVEQAMNALRACKAKGGAR
ncbi:energy-coupling factor transporter ATPase [Agathobaculum desmolans]|uniref:energy-coupling factor transporter ATPase n=1 Tax=Agathobaculum desmolans TaxID=39484 RepID=UPI00248EE846|nr:energy-coupling factor transporter ATPase [Agathobaculum desmolans]